MNKYNQQIDIMKGIAILLVVVGHLVQFSFIGGGREHPLYLWIYKYHMNVFFFCSGCLFFGLNMENGYKSGITIIKKKITRLLLPYLIWTVIKLCIDDKSYDMDVLLDYIVFRPRFGLWFLKDILIYSIIVTILFISFSFASIKYRRKTVIISIFTCMLFLVYIRQWHFFYFLLGILFVQNIVIPNIITNRWIIKLASLIFLCSLLNSHIPNFIVSIAAIVFFYNVGRTAPMPNIMTKSIVLFGKHSMPIFLVHFLIVHNIQLICSIHPFVLFSYSMAISVAISFFCIAIYKISYLGIIPMLLWGEKIRHKDCLNKS